VRLSGGHELTANYEFERAALFREWMGFELDVAPVIHNEVRRQDVRFGGKVRFGSDLAHVYPTVTGKGISKRLARAVA